MQGINGVIEHYQAFNEPIFHAKSNNSHNKRYLFQLGMRLLICSLKIPNIPNISDYIQNSIPIWRAVLLLPNGNRQILDSKKVILLRTV